MLTADRVKFERPLPPEKEVSTKESPLRNQILRLESISTKFANLPDQMGDVLQTVCDAQGQPSEQYPNHVPVSIGSDLANLLAGIANRLEIAHHRVCAVLGDVDVTIQ